MSDATGTELESTNTYKTAVVLRLQCASRTYLSPESSEEVVRRLVGGHPVFLQTYDGHCAIINPSQVPAMEVYDA